jgi:RNA polymerase sigma-70 factor (sigma-E family)
VTASGGHESPAAESGPPTKLPPPPKPDAGSAVTTLYHRHYRSLVRLAALLVQDIDAAEALVQDSFVAMHSAWRRLADTDRALAYLHQAVVTRSRSALRHRLAAGKILPAFQPCTPSASPAALTEPERSALVFALRTLAPRQREALVLMYYAGLPEAQIASAMRISKAAVKNHTTQAMSSLRAELHTANR